jgi:2-dehydro-3-deoxygluconokinase
MKRMVCFGEMLMRLSPPGDERLLQSAGLVTSFGGSEVNAAISMAHFGLRPEMVTYLPANAIGDAALRALRAEGVDVSRVRRGGRRMGLYFVERGADLRPLSTVYDRADSSFAELDAGEIDWDELLRGADWLHVSGITPALGEGPWCAMQHAYAAARRAKVGTSLDLNWRPALWGKRDPKRVIPEFARQSDVIIGNPGAIAIMLGVETAGTMPESPEALHETARRLTSEFGCGRVAITQREVLSASEHGWRAFLYEAAGDQLHASRRHQVRVVDRVGGGDSFVAGLLWALLDGQPAPRAVEFAAAASALKLTIPGDFNRVTVAEVQRLLPTAE